MFKQSTHPYPPAQITSKMRQILCILQLMPAKLNILKITKEKHLHFPLSRQKHAKTHINRLTAVSELKNMRGCEERKSSCCAPRLTYWRHHWPGRYVFP